MKKRLLSILCALCVLCTLIPVGASAAVVSSFDDISDAPTAAAVETLRVMGVLDGFSDGTFRPDESLNRAQFCKMVILVTGSERELGRYSVITVFPDVKPSYWAAPYINLAARGQNIIKGYSDGLFHPERTVTLGQAVTILLRLLGYKDEDVGGVWPDGYMSMAASTGLTDGVGDDSSAALGRGRAAILFSNLLRASTASGTAFCTLSAETTLKSFDTAAGTMVTENGTYSMDTVRTSAGLVGNRGKVVLRDDKALTFLPTPPNEVTEISGAVFVQSDRSARGLSALTEERDDYRIVKNGLDASASDLRAGDVMTYVPATNTVSVCDTRLTAYYENCYPSPDAPERVELLSGTTFSVLPTATDMLSNFRPGQLVTFLLAAGGQIAGAVESDSGSLRDNAVFIRGGVSDSADSEASRLLCGGGEIPVKCAIPDSVGAAARVSWDSDNSPRFHALTSAVSGTLDLSTRKLGSTRLADNVRIYDEEGDAVTLNADILYASKIAASRVNWAGRVDLIVLDSHPGARVLYGLAQIQLSHNTTEIPVRDEDGRDPDDEDWIPTYEHATQSELSLSVDSGGTVSGPYNITYDNVRTGDMVSATFNKKGTGLASVKKLKKVENVSFSSWAGKSAVSVGGRTYTIPEGVLCYNRDNGRWMSLDDAKVYAKRAALYVEDGIVRVLEVRT
ncbi:MAG: S-layer homology domain-containing protein [Oscillibacter sp.]|nr:S-layer homology domain-containing protein [Oscillibacter sp.]